MLDSCNLALYGWPRYSSWSARPVEPCPGFIESDYEPGTFYPCVDCNPHWRRVPALTAIPPGAAGE